MSVDLKSTPENFDLNGQEVTLLFRRGIISQDDANTD